MTRETAPTATGTHIVITDFNGCDQTRRCLQALHASDDQDFTILVVDHGTDGRTREMLASEYPEVIRVEGSSDIWWTGATNLGIGAALTRGASAVMLLNNDCYVTPEALGVSHLQTSAREEVTKCSLKQRFINITTTGLNI